MGRPTKLTPETIQKLVYGIERGLRTDVQLCRYAGISTTLLGTWRERADNGDEEAQIVVDAMNAAREKRALSYLEQMRKVGKADWRMWRDLLAMVEPEAYGRQQDVKVAATVETRGQLTYSVDAATADTIFEILAAVGALEIAGVSDESAASEL
jgi:hypothetical protein